MVVETSRAVIPLITFGEPRSRTCTVVVVSPVISIWGGILRYSSGTSNPICDGVCFLRHTDRRLMPCSQLFAKSRLNRQRQETSSCSNPAILHDDRPVVQRYRRIENRYQQIV